MTAKQGLLLGKGLPLFKMMRDMIGRYSSRSSIEEKPLQEFRLKRQGQPDLVFRGKYLGGINSLNHDVKLVKCLYRRDSGQIIVHISYQDEQGDINVAREFDTPDAAIDYVATISEQAEKDRGQLRSLLAQGPEKAP